MAQERLRVTGFFSLPGHNGKTDQAATSSVAVTGTTTRKSLPRITLLLLAVLVGLATFAVKAEAAISNISPWTLRWSDTTSPFAYPGAGTLSSFAIPASSSNRVLLVAIGSNATASATQTLSTVRYGGRNLVLAAGNGTTSQPNHSYIYYLNEAGIQAATSTNLEVTITGGTAHATWIYTAVYDGVTTTPIADAKFYASGTTANTTFGPLNPTLTVNDSEQAVVIANVARSSTGTTVRNLTWVAPWTPTAIDVNCNVTGGYTSHVYISERSLLTAGSEGIQMTASNTAYDSMVAVSMAPYLCASTSPVDLAAPSVNYDSVSLTWTYDGTNNTSYNVYRDGLQVASGITTGSYLDTTVAQSTPYTYTVRGFNGTCESTDSNSVPVTTPTYTIGTSTGAISFSNVSMASMAVSVTYTGDDDTNNSMTLSYGTTSGGPYPNPVTVSVDRPSRTWSGTANGLSASTTYYFQATFSDGSVSGTNPLTGSQATKLNSLMHSSAVTGDKYAAAWGGSWGTEFTCNTCHASPTTNIKRIATAVNAPGAKYTAINGRPLLNNTLADGAANYATITGTNRVCDVCHDNTSVFKYNTNGNYTDMNPDHPASTDCIKCHKHDKGFKVNASCTDCHDVQGTYYVAGYAPSIVDTSGVALRGENYGGHLRLSAGENLATVTNWSDRCLSCHDGHVNTEGVHIPNNTTVGINYNRGWIALGGSQTSGTTEAEICWNCHDAVGVSEWGTNTAQTGSPAVVSTDRYDYGSVTTSNWTTATWSSAKPLFAYKTGKIQSTHSVNTAGSSALKAGGSAYAYYENVDAVENIRCSYCHDVHNTANLKGTVGGDVNGKPYLRGTWWTNPYEEDGAPQTGKIYFNTQRFGAVPRGNGVNQRSLGGFWIDINNVRPGTAPDPAGLTTAANGTTSANPTTTGTTWTTTNSAGLCMLCHTQNRVGTAVSVDTMDWEPGENLWLSTTMNGHRNAVIGGTTGGGTNIFNLRGGQTACNTNANAAMHFFGCNAPNDSGGRGFRNGGTSAYNYTPSLNPSNTENNQNTTPPLNNWGTLTIDATTVNSQYHKFSCSKCHNPHASRLPKLMITNCLDTKHNTWDDTYQLNGSAGINNNRSLSNWSSAQNCHRLGGIADGTGPEPVDANAVGATHGTGTDYANRGWNLVTPWTAPPQ